MTGFQLSCINNIKQNIMLPAKGWAVINAQHIRFGYRVRGSKNYEYITLTSQEAAAQFMHRHGKINTYTLTDTGVRFYIKKLEVSEVNHAPHFKARMVELKWSEIKFTPEEVLHYAALQEYNIAAKKMGLTRAKVINMVTDIFHAA